jgi:serine/threonine protein kinase
MSAEIDDPHEDPQVSSEELEGEARESIAGQANSGVSPRAQPSLSRELTIGTVVNGKYRIESLLGRGAMGVVAECQHIELEERVALKFLLAAGNTGNEDLGVRFLREAQMSARLKNEHISRVVDVGVWDGAVPYMVMEYLEGKDLRATIRAHGRLPAERAIEYAVQACEGVAEAHARGIVHRDLKPSNLFVTRRADGSDLIKILDFGISKWNVPEHEIGEGTETGIILGSPKYMSPEQIFASSKVDARSDVWSLGAIVYEMLVGRPPFDLATFAQTCAELSTDRSPPSICAQVPEVPPALESAIFRCFERAIDRRTQNVADLAGELLEAIASPFADLVRARIEATLDSRASAPASLQRPESVSRIVVASFAGVGGAPLSATGPSMATRSDATLGSASVESASVQVLLEAPGEMTPSTKRRALLVAIVVGIVLASAFAVGVLAVSASRPTSVPASDVPALQAVTPPSSPAVAAAAPSASAEPPSVEASAEAPLETRPRVRPAVVHARPVAAPPVTPTTAPPAAPKPVESVKKNCDPPYVLSSDGIKSYKPECF